MGRAIEERYADVIKSTEFQYSLGEDLQPDQCVSVSKKSEMDELVDRKVDFADLVKV